MKKIIGFLVVLSSISACSKNGGGGFGDDPGDVQIFYKDSLGNPLFTNGQNGYYEDSVLVYDLNNNPMTPNPSNWAFATSLGNSLVFVGELGNQWTVINGYTKILIHLKAGVDDTLRGHYYKGDSRYNFYDSTWYNGVLRSTNLTADTFTIVKSANGYDIEPH